MKTTPQPLFEFIERLPLLAALAGAAAGTWSFAVGILGSLSYRYPFEYGEPVVLLPVLRMKENPWIYGDIAAWPHLVMPYHPVYLYVSYAVSLITGPTYACGRGVTAVSTLACAVLIALICRRRTGASVGAALLAGLLFLAAPFLLGEATHVKPDLMALAFALGGLFFALDRSPAQGKKTIIFAAVCFALAFLTKQNAVLAAVAAWIYLLSQRRFRAAAGLAGLSITLALAGVAVMAWGSRGHYWDHTLLNANAFYSVKILWINWQKIGPAIGALLACGAVGSVLRALTPERESGSKKNGVRPEVIYFIVTAPVLLLLGKSGWGENHAIEPLAAACIVIGSIFGAREGIGRVRRVVMFVLAVVVAIQVAIFVPYQHWDVRKVRSILEANEQAMDLLLPTLKSVRGPILAENPGLLIAAGLPVNYLPYEIAQLSYAGKFDQEVILQELRERKYGMVVVQTNFFKVRRTGRFTPEFIQTLGAHYRFVGIKSGQFFYLPQPAAEQKP
jgi:hypothetical protein